MPDNNISTPDLTSRAMLASLHISQWSGTKHDRKVSREVANSHNVDYRAGRYHKSLLAVDALKAIRRAANDARTEHYRRTLPWSDDGPRILSAAGYFDYQRTYGDNVAAFEQAKQDLYNSWPQLVTDAQQILNGLFNPADYPDQSQLMSHFRMSMDILPMPTSSDFRVSLAESEVNRIRQDIESSNTVCLQSAVGDIWTRLQSVVQHMSDRLQAYSVTPEGKVQSPFRDSLVSNITELLDLIPSLNLTDDPDITAFSQSIRADLTQYTPAELRDSEPARKSVASQADDILARMSEFVA
jgi:hypothetical protein